MTQPDPRGKCLPMRTGPRAVAGSAGALPSLLLLLATLGLLLTGCGGARGGAKGGASGDTWGVTRRIPSDTPYIFAALTPVPDALVTKFSATFEAQLAQAHRQLLPLLAASDAPWAKVASTLLDEIRTQKPTRWWQNVGFAPGGRFALYGLSLWPVVRLEVANADTVQKTVQRYLGLAQLQVQPTRQKDWTIWQLTFGPATVIVAISAKEAVVAAVPAQLAARALPWLTGEQQPERSLADDRALGQLMAQHSFLPYIVGYADLQSVISILSGRAAGVSRELGESLNLPELAGCAADVDRLAALIPRLAFGYTRLDEQAFSGGLVLEMPPHAVAALGRVATTSPGVTWPVGGKPLFAMEASVDVGNAIGLLGDLGKAIEARPFSCGALHELNAFGASLRKLATEPLPPIVTGLRGLSIVVEDATTSPVTFVGQLTAVGEQLETVQTWLAMIPGFGDLKLAPDGTPASLPVGNLGLTWAPSAHLALRGDRLTVAVGGDSARKAADQLKTAPTTRAPLFGMTFDAVKAAKLSPEAAQAFEGYQTLRDVSFTFELRQQGLYMNADGSW